MDSIKLLDKFSGLRILVVGDVMLDHYIWGDVNRISPEAPVPVVHVSRDSYSCGGAANVSLNLANLGITTSLIGYATNDDAGVKLNQLLIEKNVLSHCNHFQGNAPTIIKTRVFARNQQLCRIDREGRIDDYCADKSDVFYKLLDDCLSKSDAVIISDYAKGVITQPLINYILNAASKRSDLLVAIDPKPTRKLTFKGVGLLTPNRSEALQLAGLAEVSLNGDYPLEEICCRIHDLYEPARLVITLGAGGMAVSEQGKLVAILPTNAREVFDVSGAGDTVIAVLTASLVSGMSLMNSAECANIAAGTVVAHMGTVPVLKTELVTAINKYPNY